MIWNLKNIPQNKKVAGYVGVLNKEIDIGGNNEKGGIHLTQVTTIYRIGAMGDQQCPVVGIGVTCLKWIPT